MKSRVKSSPEASQRADFRFPTPSTDDFQCAWQSWSANQIIISPKMALKSNQGAMELKIEPKIKKSSDLRGVSSPLKAFKRLKKA